MKDFLNKFNIFDVFSVLLPGTIVLVTQWILLPQPLKYDICLYVSEAQYLIFFVFAYFLGFLLHEINRIIDPFWHKIFYGGNLREILLDNNKRSKLVKNPQTASLIDKHIINIMKTVENQSKGMTLQSKSVYIFGYILNFLELHNYISKSEKMTTIAEMSTSILNGFCLIFVTNAILGCVHNSFLNWIYIFVMISVLLSIPLLIMRKRRYEQFRVSNLLRIYDMLQEQKETLLK